LVVQRRTAAGFATKILVITLCARMPAAHPEGYIEAFANFYRDAADIIRAHRSGGAIEAGRVAQVPDVIDGTRGVKFVAAAVESNAAGGAWTAARFR